nr:nucleotide disphospho-sugar-binding domain-containing protein [Maricaulis parjimensis]
MGVHFVSGPAPHDRLFPHCSAVIHHGGAGTLDTAARAGVPQIILPQVLDQFWNARQLADTGAGIILRKKDHTAENIDAALQTILSDSVQDTARQAAERLKARASTAELVSLIEAYGVAR